MQCQQCFTFHHHFLQTDWNDGLAASALVKAKGGPVPNFREMDNYPENWVSNLDVALSGGSKIGVPKVLESKDMANPNVEYLGVMAWVAQFQWIPDKTPPGERMEMRCNVSKIKIGEEVRWYYNYLREHLRHIYSYTNSKQVEIVSWTSLTSLFNISW